MSTQQEGKFQAIISHAKEYGFVFSSSEIYDGLSAVYDYGPYGSELKKNIRDYWWKAMTQLNENIVGIDAAIFMHPTTWKASGHVDSFSDPMIDNKDSKKRYRVDHLIEAKAAELTEAGDQAAADSLIADMDRLLAADDYKGLRQLLDDQKIVCSISKTANWTDIRQFNLMFDTQLGSVTEEANTIYLRPETAQGIFVNFLNVQKTARMKIPFGIAQTGKAFRNEIVARQFIFRMREFEQMEMQFFVRPGTELEWYEKWKQTRLEWHLSMGTPKEKLRFHDHVKLAHYANAAVDIEFEFPFGFKELEGIHSRTDYDLSRHQEFSGKKLTYFDTEINKHYVPYVVETSIGLDRMFLAVLSNSYEEETITKEDGSTDQRVVLHITPKIAPVKLAVFPLTKKDGLPELAHEIYKKCAEQFRCFYEVKDAIGKRYRRQDAIGTPFCVTVDHQSLEDQTVTIRHRDSMEQQRINIADLIATVQAAL
jgi:glycyl-tRNA synthetase